MRILILTALLVLSFGTYAQHYYLFAGTYTSGKSEGIYVYDFNSSTGDASPVSTMAAKNPSFLAIGAGGKYVYSVGENGTGKVSAFGFDKTTGQLHFINEQESAGADPCFVAVNRQNNWAVVANYTGGSLSALPIGKDGSLGPVAQVIAHTGHSADTARQEKAHVHSTFFSPDQRYVISCDLGTDQLNIYQFQAKANQPLKGLTNSVVNVHAGSGPRHLVFHPSRPFVYVIEELTGTVEAYGYHNGHLTHKQRISSVPDDFKGDRGSADIHISPNGKFLYASNRGGANNIAVFAIDSASGKLQVRGFQSVLGIHPRNFIIEPTGRFLLVANRDTDNVVVFRINASSGLLSDTGKQIHIPNPVCLKMLRK